MSAAKVERLFTLLQVLLDADVPIPARRIRARVPGYSADDVAFRRAFERDKVDLGDLLGEPVRSETIPGSDPPEEGYRVRAEDAYLRDPGLTDDERRAVAVASSAVRLAGVDASRATSKLGADQDDLRGASGADDIGDDVGGGRSTTEIPATELPADAAVVALFDSVASRRVVSFEYRGETRQVHPLRLSFARGRWYLSAYDIGRDGFRTFRRDRIDSEVRTGPPHGFSDAPTPPPIRLDEPWALGDGDTVEVLVKVDAARADAARRGAPQARVTEDNDGGVVLALDVRHGPALRSFVLGLGEHAEIVSPPQARADMVAWLSALAGGDDE